MIFIIKVILFAFSCIGFCEVFIDKARIKPLFAPAITICFQVSILFLAGILNCLYEMTVLLFLLGVVLSVFYLMKQKNSFFDKYLFNIDAWIYFFIVILVCSVSLKGSLFVHYDNFSHWALVVKNMLLTDRYPSFQDNIIMFQYYPLGSSTYIYYVSRLISRAESIQMMAQVLMMTSFILPIFQFRNNKGALFTILMILFTNFIFVHTIFIQDLLVDTLLPLAGMVSVSWLYYEYVYTTNNNRPSAGWSVLFLITILQIKNSGIYFAIFSYIIILILLKKKKIRVKDGIVSFIIPLLSLFIWKKHCNYVFAASEVSKHAMSISNYKGIFGTKTKEEMIYIFKQVVLSSLKGKYFYGILLLIVIIGIVSVIMDKERKKEFLKLFVLSAFIYLTYMIGVLLMFLFSMPGGEATSLAGFERYRNTIFIALSYIVIVFLAICSNYLDIKKKEVVLLCTGIIAIVIVWRYSLGYFKTVFDFSAGNVEREWIEERSWIEQVKTNYNVLEGEGYCITIENDDAGYAHFLCKYVFMSNNVESVLLEDFSEEVLKDKQYLILYDRNETIDEWVNENYPEQIGAEVIVL